MRQASLGLFPHYLPRAAPSTLNLKLSDLTLSPGF
jgi:hypothetical protein